MIIVGLLIAFTNLLYYLIAILTSYKLGIIIHSVLEKKIEFFQKDNTEWIIIGFRPI